MNLKQIKAEVAQQYAYRIELHAHTAPASGCSEISPQEMAQIYSDLHYDAMVLTNHFMYQGEKRTKAEYIDRYLHDFEQTKFYGDALGVKIYLGAEIRFTENTNDYLIYGVDRTLLEEVYDYLPHGVVHFRENYKMPNSVFIQAHPFRNNVTLADPAILDGIEVFNMHPGHNSRIGVASVYAKGYSNHIVTGGSDFHHLNHNHEGVAAMRAPYLPQDSWAVAKLMKKGDFLLEIGRNHIIL